MNALIVALAGLVLFFFGYRFYSKYLSEKIYRLDPSYKTPAHEFNDGVDYVPTNKFVLWGHHFSSIAGAAPIIGPAIAVIWGWVPAFIWVVFGTIFLAGMHDLGTLWASVRNKGQSVGTIANRVIGRRGQSLFLIILFLLLLMINTVFAVSIANLFIAFPGSVLAYWLQLPLAILFGYMVYRKGANLLAASLISFFLLLSFVFIGYLVPVVLPETMLGMSAVAWWVLIMLLYGAIASRLPVWLLLQPRDFINSHLLFFGLILIYVAVFVGRPEMVAPMVNSNVPADTPSILPLLFVTIACGAISGAHGLASAGTTSKMLNKETDARFVGYFGAVGEGMLALASILAVSAGFASFQSWQENYSSWVQASDGATPAFVFGAGSLLSNLGISPQLAAVFVGVMVVAFAATSLDTCFRVQRFITEEIGDSYRIHFLTNKNVATVLTLLTTFLLAFFADPSRPGEGGMILWPLFGTTNQMTAALSLLLLTLILWRLGRNSLVAFIPFLFIAVITTWSLVINIFTFIGQGNVLLFIIGVVILAINIWMILEGFFTYRRGKGEPVQS